MSTAIGQWRSVLPHGLAARAVEVAAEIAERVRQPLALDAVDREVIDAAVGVALLHGQLDRHLPDQGWDKAAHGHLAHAAATAERSGTGSAALFGGLGGLGFATWLLSHDGTRYRRLIAELDQSVIATATARAEFLSASPAGTPVQLIDVVSGLAGNGRYLLGRKDSEPAMTALRAVLAALVTVSDSDDGRPHWHTPPPSLIPGAALAKSYPGGYLDCGLAHGVAGPMALLALARQAGIEVPGQAEAVERIARWIAAQRIEDEWGANWPAAIPLQGDGGGPTHAAWCYGVPGVARALWLAGTAIEDAGFRELAVSALKTVYTRPPRARLVDYAPGLCHGTGGLLEITLRFAHDTGDPAFAEAAAELTERLLELHEPDRPYGFRAHNDKLEKIDDPGLLDGAAGPALALLAAGTDTEPGWDGMLLLS
jgi:hypothetical protein